MKTLLRIDASIRIERSHTRRLADYFQSRWLHDHLRGRVIHRSFSMEPVPHLRGDFTQTTQFQDDHGASPSLAEELINELIRADHVLIGSPLYNLGIPSTLKAYFDHVICAGATFEMRDGKFEGLLTGKAATLITARGGIASTEYPDFQTDYLRALLAFIGIDAVDVISIQGTAMADFECTGKQQIDYLFTRNRESLSVGRMEVGQ